MNDNRCLIIKSCFTCPFFRIDRSSKEEVRTCTYLDIKFEKNELGLKSVRSDCTLFKLDTINMCESCEWNELYFIPKKGDSEVGVAYTCEHMMNPDLFDYCPIQKKKEE